MLDIDLSKSFGLNVFNRNTAARNIRRYSSIFIGLADDSK